MSSGEDETLQTTPFAARSTGRLNGKGEKERVYRERCSHSAAFFVAGFWNLTVSRQNLGHYAVGAGALLRGIGWAALGSIGGVLGSY